MKDADIFFSYEKTEGVCNKCGLYMKSPVAEPGFESKIQKKLKISKSYMIVSVILLLLIILLPFVGVFLTQKEVKHREQLKSVGVMEPVVYQINEKIEVEGSVLRISGCKLMDEWQEFAPEGFQLIFVGYEMESEGSNSFGYDCDVYLKLPSQEYVEPIDIYRLAEEIGCDWHILLEEYGVVLQFDDGSGNFIFLVPETVTEAKLDIYYIPFRDDLKSVALEDIYEVELDWRDS